MEQILGQSPARAYGSQVISWARFAPAASPAAQVRSDAFGIKSIVRSGAGVYVVTLAEKAPSFVANLTIVDTSTDLHDLKVTAYDYDAGTFTITHRSATLAALDADFTALAASDDVDEIWLEVTGRVAT